MGNRASQTAWRRAETKVRNFLRYRGVDSTRQSFASEYDLLTVGGQKIEVKWSSFITKADGWRGHVLNIHRHGALDESAVDWYVAVLGPDPTNLFGNAVHSLVIPAPVEKHTLVISPRSLVTKWAGYVNNWRPLVAAEQAAA